MQTFDINFLDELSVRARASTRRRINHNVHAHLDDPVQRLFIAIEPGSYVRPHRHPQAEKHEMFVILRGRLAMILFDDRGRVLRREELSPQGPLCAIEIPPDTWHSLVALATGSIFFEVKRGPYMPLSDKDFAAWAPAEGDTAAASFERWLAIAQSGEAVPTL